MKNAALRKAHGPSVANASWHHALPQRALWVALALALGTPTTQAQTVVDGGTPTRVTTAPNGVPVVNIAAPNSAGVSHNTYRQFDIGSNGLILNNSGAIGNTQLAGYIGGNPNLGAGQGASLILNEVTSASPSTLNGALEVAGRAAQVVVANSNGISCNGCGFINAPRGTLTTGRPLFAGNGSLDGLAVTGGTVTVGGQGLLAGSTDRVDLLARAVAVNAGVWARQLNVVTGANRVDPGTLATQPLDVAGPAPSVALDVSALGGMYANAIRLIGTEAGLGVNNQGQIIAQDGDLTLTSAGQVVLAGRTSATGNLTLNATQAVTNLGTLAAGNSVTLGGTDLGNNGVLYSGNALTLDAAGQITNSGQIEAHAGALTMRAQGAVTGTSGSMVHAGGPVSLSGASFDNAGSFESARGITLQVGGNTSNSGILSADTGDLDLSAVAITNTGSFAAGGNATLHAVASLASSGTLVADGTVTLTAPDLSTTGTVQAGNALAIAGNTLTNSGRLYALNGAWATSLSGAFANQAGGAIYGSQNVTINAVSLTNAGSIEAQQGDTVTLAGTFDNSGTLQSDQYDVMINAASLTNSGILSAQRNLQWQTNGAAQNSGVLVSRQAFNLTAGSFDNQYSGQIQSGADATFAAASLGNEGAINLKGNATLAGGALNNAAGAQWVAAGTLTLDQSGDVANAGILQAGGGIDLEHAASLTNSGTLQTIGGNLALTVGTLTSTGTLGAYGNATLDATNSLRSTGVLIAGGALTLAAPTLVTAGTVQAGSSLGITGGTLANSGKLYALGGDWTTSLSGALANRHDGDIYSSQALMLNAASLTSAGGIEARQSVDVTVSGAFTNSGTLQSDQAGITINATSLANAGTLSADQTLQWQIANVAQSSGMLVSGQAMNLSSRSFDNQAGGQIQSGGDLAVSAVALTNAGIVNAKGNAVLGGSTLGNAATGQLLVAGTLTLDETGAVDNAGVLQAGSDFALTNANSLTNAAGATLYAGRDFNLALSQALGNAGMLYAARTSTLSVGSVDNAGTLRSGGTLSLTSVGDTASSGAIQAQQSVSLLGGANFTNSGRLYAIDGGLTVQTAGGFRSTATGDIYSGQAIGYRVGGFGNAGTLEAAQGVDIVSQGDADNGGTLQADHGDVAISADVLANQGTLSANGAMQLDVRGALTNAGQVVANGALSLVGMWFGNSGQMQSAGDTALQSTSIENSGRLQSGGALSISRNATLTNEATGLLLAAGNLEADTAALLSNAGVIQSGGNLSVQGTGGIATATGSTLYGAALTNLQLGGNFTNAGTVYGGQGVRLTTAGIDNAGTLRSDAALDVATQSDADNSGTSYAIDDTGWNVGGTLTNTGVLASAANTTLTVGSLSSNGTLAAGLQDDGTLGTSGALAVTTAGDLASQERALAAGNLDFAGQAIDLTGSQTRAGGGIALTASQGNVTNTAGNLAANGTVTIRTPGSLINGGNLATQGGSISGAVLDLAAVSLDNRHGALTQTGTGDLTLSFAGAFDNAGGDLSGNAGNLTIRAASLDNAGGSLLHAGSGTLTLDTIGNITNTQGRIAGNGTLRLQSGDTLANDNGALSFAGDATVAANAIDDSQGSLLAHTINATATQAFTNVGGTVQAAGALMLDAGTLDNTGGYLKATGAQTLDVTISGALINGASGFIGGNGAVTLQAGELTNAGQIYAGQSLAATARGLFTNDGGALQAMSSLSATSGGALGNRFGQIEAGAGDVTATLGLDAASLDNTDGRIANTGQGSTTITGNQGIANRGGTLGGQGAVALIAAHMDNSQGGHLVAGQDLDFAFGGMDNTGGTAYAAGNLGWNNASANLANAGGNLGAGGDLALTLQSLDNADGALAANGSVALTARTLDALGRIAAGQNLTLTSAGSYANTASSQLVSNGDLTLNLGGDFSNAAEATLQAVGTLAINASSIDNAAGATLNSAATMLTTGGALTNEGSIEGNAITLTAGTLTNTANIIGGALVLTAGNLTNGADLGGSTANNAYQSALIAGSSSIALYVGGTLLNRDATIYTLGNLTIGANTSGDASQAVTNLSGDIEADGGITLNANQFTNQRRVFQTATVALTGAEQAQNSITGMPLARYLSTDPNPDHQPPNVTPDQVIGSAEFAQAKAYCDAHVSDNARCNGYPQGVGAPVVFQSVSTYTITAATALQAASARSQLLAGGNITLSGSVLNDKSTIAAGNNLIINGQNGGNGGGNTSTATVQNVAWTPNAQVAVNTLQQTDSQYLVHDPRRWVDGGWWTYGTSTSQQSIALTPGATPGWITYNAGPGLAASMTAGNTVDITAHTIDNTVVDASGKPVQAVIGLGVNHSGQTVVGAGASAVAQASGDRGPVDRVALGNAPGQVDGSTLNLAPDNAPANSAPTQATTAPTTTTASAGTPAPGSVPTATLGGDAAPASPQVVGTLVGPHATVVLPQSGLYTVTTNPTAHFLIETNPQFTRYNTFLSSDYLLQQLGFNPAATQQRLGDGFHEQQQVLAQITELTGRRYLADDTDALNQYRDLMSNAVDVAKQFDLSVGVALTPAQMANLTQDIVWLVSVTVDDHQVLEPVVYLSAANAKNLAASGATIAGKNVILTASGELTSNGTIAAGQNAQLTADTLLNSGTIHAGNNLSINAAQDILNGGTLSAGGNVSLVAGNNVLSGVNVAQSLGGVNLAGLSAPVGTVALTSLSLPGSISAGGNLSVAAGRDLTLDTAPIAAGSNLSLAAGRDLTATATAITAGGDAQLLAGRDLSLLATASTNRLGETHNNVETTLHTVDTLSTGGTLSLLAGHDLTSQGAQLAGSALLLGAGHDANLQAVTGTTTHLAQELQDHTIVTAGQIDQSVRGTTLDGTQGIGISAGNDLTVTAGQVSSTNGNITLAAGHDLNLNVAQEDHSSSRDAVASEHGFLSSNKTTTHDATSDSYAIGTTVSGNNVTLAAGHDLTTQAAQLEANGALSLSAGHDVTLGAGEQTHTSAHSEEHTSSSLFNTGATRFGSLDPEQYRRTSQSSTAQTWSIGSTLSGDTVSVAAGHNLTGTAVQIAGTHDVTLAAGNNLTLNAGKDTYSESDGTTVSRTGLMNGGGLSVLIGNRTTANDTTVNDTSYTGSLVGSTNGAVTLTAGHDVHITSSDVLSQTATTIVGQNVTIDAVVGSTDTTQTQKMHSGGIHVGLSGAAVLAVEAASGAMQRSTQTDDSRVKALYAMQAAYAADKAVEAAKAVASSGGSGINLQVGITGSTARSQTTTHDNVTYGSAIRSNGNVSIAATNGDLNVVGSQIDGNNVALAASHDINLRSQAEQHTEKNTSSNASAGVGVSFGTNGLNVYVQAAMGQGKGHGNGTTHTDTVVNAADTLSLVAGNDATIQGAQAKGNTVLANIGHNLNIASEQDTNDYASKQWQAGGMVMFGAGGGGSFSYSQNNVNNHYASVTQTSGIGAGSGGFDIHVGGNTDLKGAVIASTADPSKNYLSTQSLTHEDIRNTASYNADGYGAALNYNSQARGEQKINMAGTGPQVPVSADKSGTTQSAIAQGTLDIRDGATSDISRNPAWDNGQVSAYSRQKMADKQALANAFVSTAGMAADATYSAREASYNARIQDTLNQAKDAEAAGDSVTGQKLRWDAFYLGQDRDNPALSPVLAGAGTALAGSLLGGPLDLGYLAQSTSLDYIGNAWSNAGKGFNQTQAVKVTCAPMESACQNGTGGFALDTHASMADQIKQMQDHGYTLTLLDTIPEDATNPYLATNGVLNGLPRAAQVMMGNVASSDGSQNTTFYLQYNQTYGLASDLFQAGWDKFVAPMYGKYSATTNALAWAVGQYKGNAPVDVYGHSWGSITTSNVENILAGGGYMNSNMTVKVFGPAVNPGSVVEPLVKITGKSVGGDKGLIASGQIAYFSKYDDPVAAFIAGTIFNSNSQYLTPGSNMYLPGASAGNVWQALLGLGPVFSGTINPHSCYNFDCLGTNPNGSNRNWTVQDALNYGLKHQTQESQSPAPLTSPSAPPVSAESALAPEAHP